MEVSTGTFGLNLHAAQLIFMDELLDPAFIDPGFFGFPYFLNKPANFLRLVSICAAIQNDKKQEEIRISYRFQQC